MGQDWYHPAAVVLNLWSVADGSDQACYVPEDIPMHLVLLGARSIAGLLCHGLIGHGCCTRLSLYTCKV